MSEPHQPSPSSPSAAPSTAGAIGRYWKIGAIVAAIMVALAVLGVGLTTVDRGLARRYWMWLVPAYGLLCVVTAWFRPRPDGAPVLGSVVRQVAHWLAINGAVALDFWITGTGEVAGAATGFNALLLLALGCVLGGVHGDWLFALVGALLVVTLVCIVKAEQYLWLLFVVGALALVAIIVAARLWARAAGGRSGTLAVGT
jgi:hypothetical protein